MSGVFRFIRDDEVLGWTVAPYFAYLASIEHRLDPSLYAFVSDVDRYNLSSRKSLHDAWLRKLSLMPVDVHAFPSRMRLELEFLGPYHGRIFRLCYDDVLAYGLNQQIRTGHGVQDLLMHEFRLDEQGELLEHVFEFDDGLHLKVACQAMSFEEVMLEAEAEAEADDADRTD